MDQLLTIQFGKLTPSTCKEADITNLFVWYIRDGYFNNYYEFADV